MAKSNLNKKEAECEFIISRVFAAPRELAWKAWTVPELMAKWWGPKGFTVGSYKLDFRPGGSYLYSLRSPDGKDMWGKFSYREIAAPEKMVFINCFSDEQGGITRHPFNPNWPLETMTTVTFTERGAKTEITVRWVPLNPTEMERKTFMEGMGSMQQGWSGTLDQLEAFFAQAPKNLTTVKITRHFAATPERVFDAWLDPKTAGKWLFTTPTGKMTKVEIDARMGGSYCIIEKRGNEDAEHKGKYTEIERPKRLAFTFGVPKFPETRVTIDIAPGKGGCDLTLTHEGVWSEYEDLTRRGWNAILDGLGKQLA